MLKWFIRNRLAKFERRFDYDLSYAREILDADLGAFLAFARVQPMSKYRKDIPLDVLYAVKLVGTMAEDCGPCTQLMITMGLADGVDPKTLSAVVRGDEAMVSSDVRLGIAFARASLAHDPEAETHRDAIIARFGRRAVIALAFALTLSRVYPTMKYALGYGKACQRVVVDGAAIPVIRAAA